nr:hypothetical protein CFP56_27087 [Quercus suber]
MPIEFEKSLDLEQGSHYWIIQHVPSILLHHKVHKGVNGYETHKLRSKYLERSRGQTINQDEDSKNNISGDDISASVEKGSQSLKNIEFNCYKLGDRRLDFRMALYVGLLIIFGGRRKTWWGQKKISSKNRDS